MKVNKQNSKLEVTSMPIALAVLVISSINMDIVDIREASILASIPIDGVLVMVTGILGHTITARTSTCTIITYNNHL